jgi:CubicO group peptidase (beta-lactamase class C family)
MTLTNKPFASRLQPFVDAGALAGAIAGVASKDALIWFETVGYADIATRRPMARDTVFWIASQTKPFTAIALMMLVDEGRVDVDDPVEKYLPEFVGSSWYTAESDDEHLLLKRPATPIKVRHVLSHTSGLPFSTSIEYPSLDILPLETRVRSYTAAPLSFAPGEGYQYSNAGTNTAGRIIEVVSGRPYADFLRDRLTDPLGMQDTTFWPNSEQVSRIAKTYNYNTESKRLEEIPIEQLRYPLNGPGRDSMPAGGLFSTLDDMTRFYQMLVSGGVIDGRRYVSAGAIDIATSKQTGDKVEASYGFCFGVDENSFGHGGALGTSTSVDRKRGLIKLWFVQHAAYPEGQGEKIGEAFAQGVEEVATASH